MTTLWCYSIIYTRFVWYSAPETGYLPILIPTNSLFFSHPPPRGWTIWTSMTMWPPVYEYTENNCSLSERNRDRPSWWWGVKEEVRRIKVVKQNTTRNTDRQLKIIKIYKHTFYNYYNNIGLHVFKIEEWQFTVDWRVWVSCRSFKSQSTF